MHRGENERLEEDAQGMGRRREGGRCAGSLGSRISHQLWQGASNSREATLEDPKQRNNTASGYGPSGQVQGVV